MGGFICVTNPLDSLLNLNLAGVLLLNLVEGDG